MSIKADDHPRHDITICQDNITGIGTHVYIGGTEIHGVRSIDYSCSVNEVPTVDLDIIPERCNINVLADLGLSVDIDSLTTAIKCIQFEIRLNEDFRKSLEQSIHSALLDNGIASETIAKRLVDQVFFGEM